MYNAMANPPSEVVLYLTSKCNMRCSWCLRNNAGYGNVPDISIETIARLLDTFPRIGSACLAGFGEPLMHDGLPDIVRFLDQRRVYAGLITNGVLLDEKFDDIEWSHVRHVTVSLNAADAREHEATSGVTGGFDAALLGIESLLAIHKATILSFVIGKQNYTRINDYIDLTKRVGVKSIVAVNTLPHVDKGLVEGFVRENVLTEDDVEAKELLRAAKMKAVEYGLTVVAWPVLLTKENPKLCLSPFSRIGIDGNGAITGCIRIIPPRESFGNINEGSSIWARSDHLRTLRRGLSGKEELCQECMHCFGNWVKE